MFGVINFKRQVLKCNYKKQRFRSKQTKSNDQCTVQADNNGEPTGGNRKYPNKHGYVADMGRYLYDPKVFIDLLIDTLCRYQQRHNSLAKDNFTAACYVVMSPQGELLKIMKQVNREAQQLEPNPLLSERHTSPKQGKLLQNSGCCTTHKALQTLYG